MTNFQCQDTASIPNFGSPGGGGYTLRPGATCTGTGGYCDYYAVCRQYDANTAFAKLAQTLLRIPQLNADDVKNWAIVNNLFTFYESISIIYNNIIFLNKKKEILVGHLIMCPSFLCNKCCHIDLLGGSYEI